MLSTPLRREINNDLGEARERNLKTYAQHSLYGDTQPLQESLYERKDRSANADSSAEYDTIALKLYGENYDTHRELKDYGSKADFDNENLMPSRTTMNSSSVRSYNRESAVKQAAERTAKSPAQTKILIASYIAVVLALVLIITLASVSIASLFSEVSALQTELDMQIAEVVRLNDDLAYAESSQKIISDAQQKLNMKLPAGTEIKSYSQAEVKSAPSYTAETNWFNNFTNWLSGLFN